MYRRDDEKLHCRDGEQAEHFSASPYRTIDSCLVLLRDNTRCLLILRDDARCIVLLRYNTNNLVLQRCNTNNLVLPLALRLLYASVTPSEN